MFRDLIYKAQNHQEMIFFSQTMYAPHRKQSRQRQIVFCQAIS